MRQLTCDPASEVIGQSLLSFLDNTRAEEIHPVLEKQGLAQINPSTWYSMQQWQAVLNDMSQNPDFTSNLVAIGMAIMEKIELPPEASQWTLPEVLLSWDTLYKAQHRGVDVGEIITEKLSDSHYKTIHLHYYYPDDMVYGVGYGMAKRFAAPGMHFKVYYDKDEPHLDTGGHRTIIHFEW